MPSLPRKGSKDDWVKSTSSGATTGSPTLPSTLPVPVVQPTTPCRGKQKNARIPTLTAYGLREHWENFKRHIGTVTAPSTSSVIEDSSAVASSVSHTHPAQEETEEVDEVVVDRIWSEEVKTSVPSEHGASPDKSGGSHHNAASIDRDSLSVHEGFWSYFPILVILRWRLWPAVQDFFSLRFFDEKSESHFRQETWFVKKPLALWSSLFFILNWALGLGTVPKPFSLPDKIFFGGVVPLVSFPLLVFVMYDCPRDRAISYQIVLCAATWCWSIYQVIFMFICGFYDHNDSIIQCGSRDFLGLFYYTSALQTISLFGLQMNRFTGMVGALCFLGLSSGFILPIHPVWSRNMVNFAVFQSLLIYMHYMRETSERRLFTLRDQLKVQYKATQKAQVNERKAADSKRRLTSYVFHEVRVPLNTALLAVQNMDASGTVAKTQELEFKALEGSLSMMSKVLNDVLDFDRLDSGRFESANRPYAFHQVMRSLFIPLRLATNARELALETNLDPDIDRVARLAAYESVGESAVAIEKHLKAHPVGDGMVIGDETRLRQIITNLASNACKFTSAGGKVTISTRLISPSYPPESEHSEMTRINTEPPEPPDTSVAFPLSDTHLSQHNLHHAKPRSQLERIVVRIEVADTGHGIRPKDMAETKLFSAFNQTEQGRTQGGKGTGLGLALVRQIVKLSGGRLGVQSRLGRGSMFWVELPLGVGAKTMVPFCPPAHPSGLSNMQGADSRTVLDECAGTTAVDAATLKASQISPTSTRSSSALHSLMEQGGQVELVLSKHESHSPVPTRTIGDSSTGTQYALPMLTSEQLEPLKELPQRPPFPEESSSDTARRSVDRPSNVPLPSPKSFATDVNSSASTCDKSSPPAHGVNPNHGGFPFSSSTSSASMEVLVVDDDPLTRTLMKRMLTRMGCTVSTAENGEMALEMILGATHMVVTPASDTFIAAGPTEQGILPGPAEEKYGIVFLDNQMPVLSGLKAVEKLRSLGRRDFVVGVTGNALLSDQQDYLDAGVDHVLTKPVLERNLKTMLTLALKARQTTPTVEPASFPG